MTIRDEELLAILAELADQLGGQVTRDYLIKNGLWEGLSLDNQRAIDRAFESLQAFSRREHDFVSSNSGNVIYCRRCGALKSNYFMSEIQMVEEQPRVEAACPFGAMS